MVSVVLSTRRNGFMLPGIGIARIGNTISKYGFMLPGIGIARIGNTISPFAQPEPQVKSGGAQRLAVAGELGSSSVAPLTTHCLVVNSTTRLC